MIWGTQNTLCPVKVFAATRVQGMTCFHYESLQGPNTQCSVPTEDLCTLDPVANALLSNLPSVLDNIDKGGA